MALTGPVGHEDCGLCAIDAATKAAQREAIEAILADRWSLDQLEEWGEFGPDTLDDIMEVFYGHSS